MTLLEEVFKWGWSLRFQLGFFTLFSLSLNYVDPMEQYVALKPFSSTYMNATMFPIMSLMG